MTYRQHPTYGRGVSNYLQLTAHEIGPATGAAVRVTATAPVGDHLRGPGGVRAGALLVLADSVAGWCGGLASLPDGWVVSTSLFLRTVQPVVTGPLRLDARVLRRGRRAVVTDVVIADAGVGDDGDAGVGDDGDAGVGDNGDEGVGDDVDAGASGRALVAEGSLASAVLVPEGGPPEWERPATLAAPGYGDEIPPPMLEGFGVRDAPGGGVELDVTDAIRNPWGIVHGGVTAALVDAAGERARAERTGRPARTTDVALHYLAPARVGPVRARATGVGEHDEESLLRVEVQDRGAGGRVVAVAVTTVRDA